MNKRQRSRKPTSPGEILQKEFLDPSDFSKRKVAFYLGMDHPDDLDSLLRGELRVTPDIAHNLSTLFGPSKDFWLNLQKSFDVYLE